MRILAISGSLRAGSSNTALLRAAAVLAPQDVEITLYEGLAGLPHFNPDLDTGLDGTKLPPPVRDLRALVGAAGALLISSPEYAHGVPGSLKNALDWLVGGSEMVGKPVGLVNASPHATHAQASLVETLTVMSASIVPEACITALLPQKSLDVPGIVADPGIAKVLQAALQALAHAVQAPAEAK